MVKNLLISDNQSIPGRQNAKFWEVVIFILLLLWLGFLLSQKIDLTTADLGRHIKNGEWVVKSGFNLIDKNSPLFENYYSYTNHSFSVINHHWGSGVLFYWIYKLSGFKGLSISYIILCILTFLIFFYIAYREAGFVLAAVLSFFLLPLVAARAEIRPEIWSYLFSGIFFLFLWLWNKKEISGRWLFLLPLLTIFWVNLHIYFFLGVFIIGVYLAAQIGEIVFSRLSDEMFRGKIQKIKWLFAILLASAAGTLVNPFSWRGAIQPLTIFNNYGYTVLEEKSVWFLENYGVTNSNFLLIKAVLVLMAISLFLQFAVNRKKISFPYIAYAVFFGAIAWFAVRNFSLLGFFALPVLSNGYGNVFRQKPGETNLAKENGLAVLYIALSIVGLIASYQFILMNKNHFGIGLEPGVQGAADFVRNEKITGPIFNNYDIGGYLIFNLPEGERVFVDNRPEAYPTVFFSDVYKPMQENPDTFKETDQNYNFNSVIFYAHDLTPWGQSFLKNIKENTNWAAVYKDDYAVIFLKRNETNDGIINKYEL